ncbi:MAG TPA: hypothetical protein VG015_09000 [Candidatus Dormibacteraeota bacterium]|nr:hypothetical protein [Candidatus Dormibacteraeota bacterium]
MDIGPGEILDQGILRFQHPILCALGAGIPVGLAAYVIETMFLSRAIPNLVINPPISSACFAIAAGLFHRLRTYRMTRSQSPGRTEQI